MRQHLCQRLPADKNGVAILLIHHLRKEGADDAFNRISGTTGVQGAVDSSFTLIEDKRGSREQPELLGDAIIF